MCLKLNFTGPGLISTKKVLYKVVKNLSSPRVLSLNKNIRIPMIEKKIGDPLPEPPKKADLGLKKGEMDCFSQKGLCYSFEIWQGLQGSKGGSRMRRHRSEDPHRH